LGGTTLEALSEPSELVISKPVLECLSKKENENKKEIGKMKKNTAEEKMFSKIGQRRA